WAKVDSNGMHRDSLNIYNFAPDSLPPSSSDVIAQRLKDIGSEISMDYNEYVQAYINLYTIQRRGQVSRMLGLSEMYFPIFEAEIDRQGVPMELKYLPVVESALNPHAVSRVGATGLWQFMLPTGRLYKLDVTSYVDERRDPEKATAAAIRYLKNMYKTYGDWLLVIAAYNCGPGNVNKAIARSGGKRTFWEIRDELPRETRGYVPAFIAATYVFNYATEHNIFPKYVDFTFQTDTVHFTRQKVGLKQLAEITDSDFYMLKDLNPELRQDIVPYQGKPYAVRVPMRTGQFMAVYRDSVNKVLAQLNPDTIKVTYASNKKSPLTNRAYASDKKKGRATYTGGGTSTAGRTLVYHKVRSGEVVSTIAEKYGVTWKQLQAWNGLRGYRIKPGQRLKVYVRPKYASAVTKKKPKAAPVKRVAGGKYHVVRNGDTLWDIANAYDGLTVAKIKSLNKLKGNKLQIGQQLRIQ
ncbi:MAG: transglycosylase SLT domain-containing protein, partial [Bacteroidota bacterium]